MSLPLCPICGEPFDPRPPPGRTLRKSCSKSCGQRLAAQLGTRPRRTVQDARPLQLQRGFAIYLLGDATGRRGSRYVPRVWESYDEARRELLYLLRPYPRDSAWRKKLEVRAC